MEVVARRNPCTEVAGKHDNECWEMAWGTVLERLSSHGADEAETSPASRGGCQATSPHIQSILNM
eukprot:1137037-Pelagomonas_calceolata.AAC.4